MHASQEAIRPREISVTLKNRLRNHKLLWTALQGLRVILNKLIKVQRIYFFVHDVADQLHFHRTTTKKFDLVIGTPDIIERYRTDLVGQFGLSHPLIDERRAAGKEVLLAIKNTQVVSMLWLSFDAQHVAEIGMTLGLKLGEFLTFDARTLPAWRGHGLSPQLNCLAEALAQQRGLSRHYAWRAASNASALRVADKLHQSKLAAVTVVWILGIKFYQAMDNLGGEIPNLW